ncbi:hypothetical protein C8J57DRAFT_1187058 [Mycena rebaudengoi]|nr:hypothetical protein C8J57DRAFT_1187058 [Mycena rebaudengoi]
MADSSSTRHLPSEVRTNISALDARIFSLENSLAAARREREDLQSRLDNYKYPVLSLPLEITSEIFINFLPIYPLRPPLTGLLSPALLGQICHQWRDIAFGTPRLWRAIEIYLQSTSSLGAQLNVLSTWLSRSKNCSLSLSFEMERHLVSPKVPHFKAALVSQSERWEHIRLITPLNDLRWLDHPFPLLRRLTFGSNHPTESAESAIEVFGDAPQLNNVGLAVRFYPSQVVLPWSQLTSITAAKLIPVIAADILRQANSLVNFTCTLWGDTVPEAVPPLIHLESLVLHDWHSQNTQKLLIDALTAPVLRHLTISEYDIGDEPLSTIAAFLSRSHCSLDSLHITRPTYLRTSMHEADYCAAFPSIKVIQVLKDAEDDSDSNTDEDEE